VPPDAVKLIGVRAQTVPPAGAMLMVGSGAVETSACALAVQPSALVPVTVYKVVADGVTVAEAVVTLLLQT
jgi:hypothetical protein